MIIFFSLPFFFCFLIYYIPDFPFSDLFLSASFPVSFHGCLRSTIVPSCLPSPPHSFPSSIPIHFETFLVSTCLWKFIALRFSHGPGGFTWSSKVDKSAYIPAPKQAPNSSYGVSWAGLPLFPSSLSLLAQWIVAHSTIPETPHRLAQQHQATAFWVKEKLPRPGYLNSLSKRVSPCKQKAWEFPQLVWLETQPTSIRSLSVEPELQSTQLH